MFIRGHQRSRGHHGSSRTVSARREANRLYPKRPTGRGRSRRRLVRASDRSRVPPPRTYRPMTSPIRRYRPIRRCTLHRCGRIDGDASPPPDDGGNHLMSETHLMRDVIRSDASLPPPPAHPSSEVIRGHHGHQRSSEASIHLLLLIRHRLSLVRRPLLAARYGTRAAAAAAAAAAAFNAAARHGARHGAAASEAEPAARHGA